MLSRDRCYLLPVLLIAYAQNPVRPQQRGQVPPQPRVQRTLPTPDLIDLVFPGWLQSCVARDVVAIPYLCGPVT
jgi:hypothetical protein